MNQNGNKSYRGKKWYQYNRGRNSTNGRGINKRPNVIRMSPADSTPEVSGPYKGWKLYHSEEYKEGSDTECKVKIVEGYIQKHKSTFDLTSLLKNYLYIDLKHIISDEEFTNSWPKFSEEITNEPRFTLDCMGLAVYETFSAEEKVSVRPMNHDVVLPLASLKMSYYKKLVTIRGTVIRVGSPGLICKSMAFECSSCRGTQALIQPQGVYTVPASCPSCRAFGKFEALQSSPFTITVDFQVAKVQETQAQGVAGSIPKSVEVEFVSDLVGIASPGDLISVTGIVQVRGEQKDDNRKGARLMQLYIEAVAVHNQRTLNHPTLTFTLKDYYAIQEIHSSDNVFQLLVQSLCPSIFGHEILKAGLILGLMGGTEIENGSRCNPHLLVVGDPGLGKSQLLQAATLAAPRGVYVCGNACTASGLTVSLTRSEGAGFTLEAGSLVLADRGICSVDELDKLGGSGQGALLEAMEQGTVSVARGGVVCRLAAAPTVLAAANPAQGHYDRSKTVSENLRMSAALLSRFDLVFILLDRPDEQMDALLSNHVLGLHMGEKSINLNESHAYKSRPMIQKNNRNLSDRLKLQEGQDFHPLPLVLLRKYIAYSRKYVHPTLSNEASKVLKEFFLRLRGTQQSTANGPPVTTRQLEACIRLTQARARINLREEATLEDAEDVVNIMEHSLKDTLFDELGNIQMTRSVHGSGMSARNQVKKFIGILTQRASKSGKSIFTRAELCSLHKAHNLGGDSATLIDALHVHGYLLQKEPNIFKILTV